MRWGPSVTSRVAGPCASSRAPRARPLGGTRDMRPRGPSPGRRDLALPADVHGPSPTHGTRTGPPHARPRTGGRRGKASRSGRGRAAPHRLRRPTPYERPPALRSPCGPAPTRHVRFFAPAPPAPRSGHPHRLSTPGLGHRSDPGRNPCTGTRARAVVSSPLHPSPCRPGTVPRSRDALSTTGRRARPARREPRRDVRARTVRPPFRVPDRPARRRRRAARCQRRRQDHPAAGRVGHPAPAPRRDHGRPRPLRRHGAGRAGPGRRRARRSRTGARGQAGVRGTQRRREPAGRGTRPEPARPGPGPRGTRPRLHPLPRLAERTRQAAGLLSGASSRCWPSGAP